MHPCLQVYDILECICSHLQESNSLDTLANLARTCTTFLDPALDALWHTIPTLTPLVRCLPEDAWTVKRTRYHSVLTLTRGTTQKDWERCTFYTHRVRQFGSVRLDTSPLGIIKGSTPTDKTVYVALRPSSNGDDSRNSAPLLVLPNLRSCRLVPHTSVPAPHWSPFLTHTLRTLELRIPTYDQEETLPRILRSIGEISPLLRVLKIDAFGLTTDFGPDFTSNTRNDELSDALGKMLSKLVHLESFMCPHIQLPDESVRYLARAKIRELQIMNTAKDILEALDHGDQQGGCFRSLRNLNVKCSSGGGLAECVRLLERVTHPSRIRSLEIEGQGYVPTEYHLRSFVQGLSDLMTSTPPSSLARKGLALNKTNTNLQTLSIRQNPDVDMFPLRHPTPTSVTLETLSPLLEFSSLKVLNLSLDNPFSTSDYDAEKMARAWPKLEELQLGLLGGGWSPELNMTLRGLGYFAKYCKELKVLGVCLNLNPKGEAEVKKGDTEAEESPAQCSSLRVLDVGDSVFRGEPEHVAECLLSMFPGLYNVFGPGLIVSPEWQKKWARVSLRVRELSQQGQLSSAT